VTAGVVSIPLRDPSQRLPPKGKSVLLENEFIAGEENALVRSIAQSVLQTATSSKSKPSNANPWISYNPWVIYGRSGVGKSHLARGLLGMLQAGGASTVWLSGADFARQFADAVETNSVNEARENLLQYDYILLDDLHQIRDKKPAQQELIILLDALLESGRRIIATLEKSPSESPRLLPALASRLSAGLVTPLHPPGAFARQQLIERFSEHLELDLSAPMIESLANNVTGTAPELKQVLLTSLTEAEAAGEPYSEDFLAHFLGDRQAAQKPTLRNITSKVCSRFNVKASDLKSATRRQAVVRARGVAMYIARQLTDKTLEEVGKHYGGRDHTTVLHACRKTESLLTTEPDLKKLVDEITDQL